MPAAGRTKAMWVGSAFVLLIAVGFGTVGIPRLLAYVAERKIHSMEWRNQATPEDIRVWSERAILWGARRHDAYLGLMEHGTEDSIPALLHGLMQEDDTTSGGAAVCTKYHCLDALHRITGEYPGPNFSDWNAWYETSRAGGARPASKRSD